MVPAPIELRSRLVGELVMVLKVPGEWNETRKACRTTNHEPWCLPPPNCSSNELWGSEAEGLQVISSPHRKLAGRLYLVHTCYIPKLPNFNTGPVALAFQFPSHNNLPASFTLNMLQTETEKIIQTSFKP
jgi:hypothetical protein